MKPDGGLMDWWRMGGIKEVEVYWAQNAGEKLE